MGVVGDDVVGVDMIGRSMEGAYQSQWMKWALML